MSTEIDAADAVATLLAAAGLTVPDNEIQRLADLYPGLRRSVDKMYEIDTGDEVPAAVFRAAEVTGTKIAGVDSGVRS